MTVCVLGSVNLDTVLQVQALPLPGQTLTARAASDQLGGKGANQAVAAARMGATTVFMGAIGADEAGRLLRSRLTSAGVDVSAMISLPGHISGRAYVTLAESGQNSIIVASGANGALRADHLCEVPSSARVLLCQLETPPGATAALFATRTPPGMVRILNAAPALPEGRALFEALDILVVNETELMTYAGLNRAEDAVAALAETASSLISRPEQAVIVTLGPAGAAIVRRGDVRMIAGRAVRAVDTTGAGDCFCGVMAAELDRGVDLESAVHLANAAAALSVTRLGAAAAAPTRGELDAFLIRHDPETRPARPE